MLEAIGDLLPAAVGVALSPFPIIAIVLVLTTPDGRRNGGAFTLGWVAALSLVTAAMIVFTGGTDDPDNDVSVVLAWAKVALGVALFVLAAKKWTTRPRPGDDPVLPGWMSSLDGIRPTRSLELGVVLGGANPKNLAFTFAAASSITAFGLEGGDAVVAAATYVALASSTVLAAVTVHLVAGARAANALESVKAFMTENNAVIMMMILILLGAKILGDGLAAI